MQNKDYLLESYDYYLPTELIAQRPAPSRDESRLLVYDVNKDKVFHCQFKEIEKFVNNDHRLVFNQTKVFPCRLFGHKESGGKAEIFILSLIPHDDVYQVLIRCRGKKKINDKFIVGELTFTISEIENDCFYVKASCSHQEFCHFLETHAKIPIPPYIRDGVSDSQDKLDYQTVYAKDEGSVAAPTAGLHFTSDLLSRLESNGVKKSFVTLHVGIGTFKPITTDNILEHQMHTENFIVSQKTLSELNQSKKIIAVGTTTLRTLESIYKDSCFDCNADQLLSTNIFLHPGKDVKSIDGLLTNFHLPKSSLLMLVSSLIGREKTLELYKIAVEQKYRFFSYGDAMLILR